MKCSLSLMLLCGACGMLPLQAAETTLSSPNGQLQVVISYGEEPLSMCVLRDGKRIIGESPLGLVVDGRNLARAVRLSGTPLEQSINEQYSLYGNHPTAQNRCNELTLPLKGAGIAYRLQVRSYDDGVAFRYVMQGKKRWHLDRELTAWNLPSDATCFWAPYVIEYETLHQKSRVGDLPQGDTLGNPLTVQTSDGYIALAEADCRFFADMGLVYTGANLQTCFPASPQGWQGGGSLVSPWRAAIIAPDLNTLVNSDLISNLCEAPDSSLDFSWVRPGRVLWQWWSSEAPKYEEQSAWYDAAARLGWEYYLIDDGWRFWKAEGKNQWDCLREVIEYGKSRGVQSVIWVDSKEMRTREEIHDYLTKVKAAGAVGIKIDFIPAPTPDIMRWYQDALEESYALQLLCNFHGCVKPSGMRRTWPHELTREAIRGHEFHISRYDRVMPMDQDAIKPFTRLLAGPADFTPTAFVPTELLGYTWPHELAQAIIYTSPLTHFADSYQWYLNHPAEDLLRDLPVTWDETRVLPFSEIGEVVGFARRKGSEYWIGIANGNSSRRVEFSLDFLPANAMATELSDRIGVDAALVRNEKLVCPQERISIQLRPGGGYVLRLRVIE